ncbi:ATP-binding protein [Streptomyces werraensis]|uniref:ATP-binding protein n=1 Tax=Streptomyces werraensis TaxID=68284 RepID=UPI0037D57C3E
MMRPQHKAGPRLPRGRLSGASTPTRRQPVTAHQFALSVTATPAAVAAARHRAVDAIKGWDAALSTEVVHAAELVISELVTNAVRHSTAGPVCLSVRPDGQSLRIEVCDDCTELPRPGLPDPCSESGRGLFLVTALADRYGVEPTAVGKCSWAEIALPTRPDGPIVSPLVAQRSRA